MTVSEIPSNPRLYLLRYSVRLFSLYRSKITYVLSGSSGKLILDVAVKSARLHLKDSRGPTGVGLDLWEVIIVSAHYITITDHRMLTLSFAAFSAHLNFFFASL